MGDLIHIMGDMIQLFQMILTTKLGGWRSYKGYSSWSPQSELNVAGRTRTTAEAALGKVGVDGTMD